MTLLAELIKENVTEKMNSGKLLKKIDLFLMVHCDIIQVSY